MAPLGRVRAPTGRSGSTFWSASIAGSTRDRSRDTASGGELSRLMLALKVALARHDAVPTLVFDELDQGIGGEVGTRVARRWGESPSGTRCW